jgi:hypothetical protein
MSQKDYLPARDIEFQSWSTSFLHCLSTMLERINFPPVEYELLVSLNNDFSQKLEVTEESSTRTKVTIQRKNEARKLLEKTLRQDIKEYLTFSRLVTNADREALGLPIYKKTHTPAPVATTAPSFDVDTSVAGRVGIKFYTMEGEKKQGKPAGQHCVEIQWIISHETPTRWDELLHSVIDTRSPYTFMFENDQRGKTLYFALRWQNTRGEKGPFTLIQNAIIP